MTGSNDPQDWTVLKMLRWAQGFFSRKNIEEPRLDAEILLGHTLGLSRIQLYTHFDQPLRDDELAVFKSLIQRRVSHEPVAYIVGEREFWSMTFKVDARVLIPRPDTETLVELARFRGRQLSGEPQKGQGELSSIAVEDVPIDPDEAAKPVEEVEAPPPWEAERPLEIVDIGTGSGAIAIALAKEIAYANVVATDISGGALEVAKENAASLVGEDRITFMEGDLMSPLEERYEHSHFDLVVSNPPYIAEAVLEDLAPEVSGHEPKGALSPGQSGLETIERLASEAWQWLRPGGYFICEIGHDQGESAAKVFEAEGLPWVDVRAIRDRFSGQHRVLEARRKA